MNAANRLLGAFMGIDVDTLTLKEPIFLRPLPRPECWPNRCDACDVELPKRGLCADCAAQ